VNPRPEADVLRAILLREADAENSSALDEYDRYLLQLVSILRTAPPREEAIAYLVKVESKHMGLGGTHYARASCSSG